MVTSKLPHRGHAAPHRAFRHPIISGGRIAAPPRLAERVTLIQAPSRAPHPVHRETGTKNEPEQR
jgi:hypothetical protein